MAVKSFKPYSAGRRFMTVASFDEVTTDKPERSLLVRLTKKGGRNQQGRLTVRHQGGGHKRMYRIIDFKRNKDGIVAKVASVEYDPNRSAYIALLHYVDGEKRYILAPHGLKVGDKVVTTAGIHGKIVSMAETTILLETEGGGKIRFDKAAISLDATKAAAPKA